MGDDLAAGVPSATVDTPLTLIGPDGRSERIPLVFTSGLLQWSYGGATLSGPYEARIGPPVSSSQRFALQLNPRESDLERLPPEMLPAQFGSSAPAAPATLPQLGPAPARSYFRLLLSLVLGLVLAETVLAWFIGRGSA